MRFLSASGRARGGREIASDVLLSASVPSREALRCSFQLFVFLLFALQVDAYTKKRLFVVRMGLKFHAEYLMLRLTSGREN
jgi:hypothetical protein